MGKYTKIFNTIEEYNTYINGDPFLPSLCLITEDGGGVKYDKRKAIKSINVGSQYYVGENVPITVNCDADIPKNVSLEVDGKGYTASVNSAGTATFEITNLSAGNKIVYVTCPDDWRYQSGSTSASTTFDVIKNTCQLKSSVKNISYGKTETIIVDVTDGATGRVYTQIGTITYYGDIVGYKVRIEIADLPASTYRVTVIYEGDDKYYSATTTSSFEVQKVSKNVISSITVENSLLKVVFSSLGVGPTGDCYIAISGGSTYNCSITNHQAILDVSDFSPGEYTVTVTYGGDNNFESATKSDTITIS